MSQMITISLPDETRTALDDAANEEGLSENALVEKARTIVEAMGARILSPTQARERLRLH